MSEKNMICPECHYGWYKYYVEHDPPQTIIDPETKEEVPIYDVMEVPIAVKTILGWLCRLCRHEWKEDGTPVAQESVDQFIINIRKSGKENHAKIHGSKETENIKTHARNKGFIPR